MPLSVEQLRALEPGDQFEAGTPLQGLSEDPIKFTVVEVDKLAGSATIEGRYLGVKLASWVAKVQSTATDGETVDWERR